MTYKILALSDLHLGEPLTDERYPLFLKVLDKFIMSDIQELLLMGDIFDILIGNKKFWRNIHPEFFKKLEEALLKNKKITWVQGNHDFQLSRLLTPMGVHWIENHEVIIREGLKISVSHGDLADEKNKLHPLWRAFLNSQFMSLFIKLIPESIGERKIYPLTLKLSKASRRVSQNKEFREIAKETFRKHARKLQGLHNADLVILGHSHISDEVSLNESSRYLNLGSWFENPQVGILEVNERSLNIKVSPMLAWLA